MHRRSFEDIKPTVPKNVHSLLCLGSVNKLEFIMENLRLVQVLHLERVEGVLFYQNLVHLRYLYIGGSNMLWEVPECICNLWNLETFIFGCGLLNKKFLKTIWKMKMLRHLEFTNSCEFDVDEDEDDNEGGHQLLENLEFLSGVILYDETSARAVLQRVPNLQKLICRLEDSRLKGKVLTFDLLRLDIYVPVLAVTFPSSLKRLKLCCWGLEGENTLNILSTTSQLPNLEVLHCHGRFEQWNVKDDEFQKLKYLQLSSQSLEQWNVSFDSFSCLEQLELSGCSNLEEVPARFTELPTLQKIKLHRCNEKLKSSAIQVQKEQKDYGNELRLIIDGEDVE